MISNQKIFCAILMMALLVGQGYGQNLLDLSGWTIGSGSATGFSRNGSTSENIREWGIGPQGKRVILWKGSPAGDNNGDGGWNSSSKTIDHTKRYRFSVWIKKTNSNSGTTYFGPSGSLKYVTSGAITGNPYFFSSDLPQLDQWYLLVSYVHGSGDSSTVNEGQIYDGITGQGVVSIRDFKFQTTATNVYHRSYLYYDTNTSNRQYFYAPRVDEVNGDEPSITELLGISPSNPNQLSVGTNDLPSGYTLSVGGDAIMEKVKVQVETAWPDYVFDKEYPLRSIEELKKYIAENGHLPGVPSATEVKASNQDLGLIQQKLLEKIEELTLYAIEQEKKLEKVKELETQNSKLATKHQILDTKYQALLARIEQLEKKNNDHK